MKQEISSRFLSKSFLGDGINKDCFMFIPKKLGKGSNFDFFWYIFQIDWFNHQLVLCFLEKNAWQVVDQRLHFAEGSCEDLCKTVSFPKHGGCDHPIDRQIHHRQNGSALDKVDELAAATNKANVSLFETKTVQPVIFVEGIHHNL